MRGWKGSVIWACLAIATLSVTSASPIATAAPSPDPGFTPNVRVTDGTTPFSHHVEPFVVVDAQGRLFVGWKEADTSDGVGVRVGFSRSLDGGATWSPNILMDRMYRSQSDPWLALDDSGRLYFGRLEFSEALLQNQGVVVSRSGDGGASWGAPSDADDLPLAFVDKSSLASDGALLYAGYTALIATGRTPEANIRVATSSDGGHSWSASVPVSDRATTNPLGVVLSAAPGGVVHAAWWDPGSGNVLSDRSVDGGRTWRSDSRVNPLPGSASGSSVNTWALPLPSIVTTPRGDVLLAWTEGIGADLDILVSRSDDSGNSWGKPVRVNDDTSGREQWQPALAVGPDGTIHIAWLDNRTGNYNVFYATSKDGRRWSSNQRVTDAETPSAFQRPGDYLGLAIDSSGSAYAVWTDGRGGNLEVYFARKPA